MSERQSVLRRAGKAGVLVAGGVMALSAVAAGTASAHEGHSVPEKEPAEGTANPAAPVEEVVGHVVDGFVAHWGQYHYQHSLVENDIPFATSDPVEYVGIHTHMVEMMTGQAPIPDEFPIGEGYPQV
ncbi:hypothetical protein GCM10010472_67590 [Pseudonocardia halophobica]|uniref:Uncharacterized protein n=1 Tax=Pseudonocardia halophobica TaxID=29401 RepID=A0A9W6NXN9_9PSEU|nr:hypothetical protein [Pseudonocardia halophobica]GLL12672.1 hypothetical protein GCM10017577_38130 [Pseudonocardia halophobica]